MNPTDDVMDYLNRVTSLIPIPMYWTNLESKILGANDAYLAAQGIKRSEDIVGKIPHDYSPKEIADKAVTHIDLIGKTKETLTHEDAIQDNCTGKTRYYTGIRSPLLGSDGQMIGIFGTSIETTAEKEAALVRLENDRQKITAKEQEKFRQIAHAIRSPISSLLIIEKVCTTISEKEHDTLREAIDALSDIANNLMSDYPPNEIESIENPSEESESILVAPVLFQILAEKKEKCQNLSIVLEHEFSPDAEFAWINIQPIAFKRTISNLVNNAIESFDQKSGKIIVRLEGDMRELRIAVEDNGKGMSSKVRQKIMSKISVTEGKEGKHGFGMAQVWETLKNTQAQLEIQSEPAVGTQIKLTFPRVAPPDWMAESIHLNGGDTIVILDDDQSAHHAWDLKLEEFLKNHSDITVKHFYVAQDTINFICALDPREKQKIFLLTDYELVAQKLDGLDVIVQSKVERSVLITSYFTHKSVQQMIIQAGTKILAKQLELKVPIKIGQMNLEDKKFLDSDRIKIDAVFLDDDQYLLDSYGLLTRDMRVDMYQDPYEFMDNVENYHRDTRIMIDNTLKNYPLKGTEIAMQLRKMGFTRLFLLLGTKPSSLRLPLYLTAIQKADPDALKSALRS